MNRDRRLHLESSPLSCEKMRSGVWLPALVLIALCLILADAEAATFTVNSPADVPDAHPGDGMCETAPGNGVCTLRAAIQEANALPGADTIILQSNVTYLLTRAGDDDTALNGDLDITDSVTIIGGGASTIIDGNGDVTGERVFQIFSCVGGGFPCDATHPAIVVSISGVTIQNGKESGLNAFGGGILNDGNLTLTNSIISHNTAHGSTGGCYGGGIYSVGPLTLMNSAVLSNIAMNDSGGIVSGGGILGGVVLINSTVSGNSARDSGGGISGSGTLIASTVSSNTAGNGGGIYGSGMLINS